MEITPLPNNSFHEQALISVIIPCYNTARYLPETLDSVLAQTYKHFEIIAIDDGSTDNTLTVLQEYAKKDSRIKIISQENTYYIIARCNGIKQSQGKYLFCLDSDDKIAPTYFEKAMTIFNKNPDLAVVYAHVQTFEAETKVLKMPDSPTPQQMLLQNCSGVGPSMLIKRDVYDEIGGFDTNLTFGEDWDLYISLFEHQKKIYRIPEVLFFYRKRADESSVCNISNQKKIAINFLKIYTKHFDFYCENDFFLQDFYRGMIFKQERDASKRKKYQKPLVKSLLKWFYKTFKPNKYQELCKKYNLN